MNIRDFLEKSLKIKSAMKSTGKFLQDLEKSLNFIIFNVGLNTVNGDLNQHKTDAPLFDNTCQSPKSVLDNIRIHHVWVG